MCRDLKRSVLPPCWAALFSFLHDQSSLNCSSFLSLFSSHFLTCPPGALLILLLLAAALVLGLLTVGAIPLGPIRIHPSPRSRIVPIGKRTTEIEHGQAMKGNAVLTTTQDAVGVVALRQAKKVRVTVRCTRSQVIERSWRRRWPQAPTFDVALGAGPVRAQTKVQ